MEFIIQLKARNKRYLSGSAYGNKRLAFYHLFRLHNRIGFPQDFEQHLTNLFRGFKREIADSQQIINVEGEVDGGARANLVYNLKEGKEPMSVELYKKLLEWFLKYNTADGVFAQNGLVWQ
jgi:hypothetical protein